MYRYTVKCKDKESTLHNFGSFSCNVRLHIGEEIIHPSDKTKLVKIERIVYGNSETDPVAMCIEIENDVHI